MYWLSRKELWNKGWSLQTAAWGLLLNSIRFIRMRERYNLKELEKIDSQTSPVLHKTIWSLMIERVGFRVCTANPKQSHEWSHTSLPTADPAKGKTIHSRPQMMGERPKAILWVSIIGFLFKSGVGFSSPLWKWEEYLI
jgi:hypothetical protein